MIFSSIFSRVQHRLGGQAKDVLNGRIVVAIECILNQNARDAGAATYSATNQAFVALCLQYQVAILQISCPEMKHLGLRRVLPAGTSLRECMQSPAGRVSCQNLSAEVSDRLQDYAAQGCQLLAIVGGNAESPGCAVHHQTGQPRQPCLAASSGALMLALETELRQRGLSIPFLGLRDCRPDLLSEDLLALERLLKAADD